MGAGQRQLARLNYDTASEPDRKCSAEARRRPGNSCYANYPGIEVSMTAATVLALDP
jgi:hypothetical protein